MSQWEKVERVIDQGRARVAEAERRKIAAINESMEPSPWLRFNGWPEHLGPFDPVELQALVRPVKKDDEAELYIIHEVFTNMIQESQTTAVKSVVGKPALVEVNRKERGKKSKKPFNSKMSRNTFQKYTTCWKQLLSYIVRCEELEDDKRPPFKFTRQQRTSLNRLMEAADQLSDYQEEGKSDDNEVCKEARADVQKALLQFCIALLDHDLVDNEYQSAIISGLAVLGVREDKGWENPEDYTPKLSAVIKLARLMVVQMAYQARQAAITRRVGQGWSQEEAEGESPGHVELVQGMCRKFMMLMDENGKPTPMDWMFEARTYGLHIRYDTTADGNIQWKGDTMSVGDIDCNMEQIRSMVLGLVSRARRRLFTQLLKLRVDAYDQIQGKPLPHIEWERLRDNPAEEAIGWSFLKDIRNKFTVDGIEGSKWLAKRVIDEEALQKEMMQRQTHPDQPMKWRKKAIQTYQREMEAFEEELLILMHCTGGQPARATEIMGIRYQNTRNGGVRNIFIEDGLVCFVTSYHKGYESSEKLKVIQRFLPREVGELLVYYLWLVRPFWECIEMMTNNVTELSPFVWGMRPTEEEDEKEPQDHPESSSNHESQTSDEENGRLRRPRKAWMSERLRKIIQRESVEWIGVKFNISAWRDAVIAIGRKYLRDIFNDEGKSEDCDVDGFDEDNEEGDSPWDLQSGHGTHIAGNIYARLVTEGKFETISKREQFRTISQEWHRFLGFQEKQDTLVSRVGKKRKRSLWEKADREFQLERWKQLRTANIYRGLAKLLGPDKQFRGKQEAAIKAIMSGQSPVIAIMGTGCGKSVLFMLPAILAPGGVTIVVTPLVSLQGNMQERCDKARITSVKWTSQNPHATASIVFVTPESAMTKGFADFITRKQEMHQLDRIVFDEGHTILDGTPQFRPKLRQLGELTLRGAQVVYLTATLPPRDEDEFYQLTHIPRDHKPIRDRTTRPNVRYQVQTVEVGVEEEDVLGWGPKEHGYNPKVVAEVIQVIEAKCAQYPAPAKMVVYCSNKIAAEKLAQAIGCDVYHRDIDTEDGKARRLKAWMNSNDPSSGIRDRIIVATNALGLGIDVPDIRVVIHVGVVWRLKDYAQESGRAGRDGQSSEAIIMMPMRDGRPIEVAPKNEKGWVDIQEFISGAVCRRVILDQVMDGRMDRERCEEGEETCDVCQGKDEEERRQAVREGVIRRLNEEIDDSVSVVVDQADDNSSEVSIDQGFQHERPRIDIADELEFESQEQERRWVGVQVGKRRRQEGVGVRELSEQLDEWHGICPWCYWQGHSHGIEHQIQECGYKEAAEIYRISQEIQKEIKGKRLFEKFGCCTWCGVPQAICEKWKQKEDVGWWEEVEGGKCQYKGVLVPAIITMLIGGEDGDEAVFRLFEEHGVDVQDQMSVCRWFGQRVEWGGIEATRMVQVFHLLAGLHSRNFGQAR
jgi:superfamily II DNA helicase RecQ